MYASFCRVTGQSRNLPRPNYFPILPPISPIEAKRFLTPGCKITCNFNPNHHYQPITKLLEEAVIKCKITEKSVFEYHYFIQPCFGNSVASKSTDKSVGDAATSTITVDDSTEYFYYELEDRILVLPKSVEKELNRGVIKDVQISAESNKIGFRYINTIKEYDLVCESTDKLAALSPTKGKGLKKNAKKHRKKSALLGELKSIFEKKEKLAEMAEKKAAEKIQPDTNKIELVKTKIINSKLPIFGYMDGNNKFHEITGESDELFLKSVIKGQMKGGVFTPGDLINDCFVPGKYMDGVFIPGVVKDGVFVPGNYIEKEVNGKMEKKFIPGKVINNVFTPGQMIKTTDGSRSEFIPGQVLTLENNLKKFVPGLLIEHVENDVLDFKFVPGNVAELNNSLVFTPGELIETNEGLKFICEKVEKDSFEIQTFDSTFDFDYEDVKAAAAVCDSIAEVLKPDTQITHHSSFDMQDGDSRSMCTTNANSSRKGSSDTIIIAGDAVILNPTNEENLGTSWAFSGNNTIPIGGKHNGFHERSLDNDAVRDDEMCSSQPQKNVEEAFITKQTKDSRLSSYPSGTVTVQTIFETLKENATRMIQEICKELNVSVDEETAGAVLQAMAKQEVLASSVMEIDPPDTSPIGIADFIFEKVTKQLASVIEPLLSQQLKKSKPETVAKILKKVVAEEIDGSIENQLREKIAIHFDKVEKTVPTIIRQVCAKMYESGTQSTLSNSNPSYNVDSVKTLEADAQKVVLGLIKEISLLSIGLMDPERNSLACNSIEPSQKEKQDLIIRKLCTQLKLTTAPEQLDSVVEKVLQEFSNPSVLFEICDSSGSENNDGSLVSAINKILKRYVKGEESEGFDLLKKSASTEKVLEDCRKILVEGYHLKDVGIMGESEVKAADMLKDHVESQLTRDLNEALLYEAIHLAEVMGKMDVVKELESLLQDDISYETVVNDFEILFILRQLVILKKLMASEKNAPMSQSGNNLSAGLTDDGVVGCGGDIGIVDFKNQELLRDSQILTEYVFSQEDRDKYNCASPRDEEVKGVGAQKLGSHARTNLTKQFQEEAIGGAVYTEETSSFFSSVDGTALQSKRARLEEYDDQDFDELLASSPIELLNNSCARHRIEVAKSRHKSSNSVQIQTQIKGKIQLKSAEELQSTTTEQLALINREATLRELIETEEEFVRDLAFVIEKYYKPLSSSSKLAKCRELFGSLKPIFDFHQTILLEGFRYYQYDPKMIGRTFLRLERYFDHHGEYSEEEPNAQAMLRDDSEIAEYFEEVTLNLGDEKSLSDHLKLPLQRINDYQLILQDLIDIQRILKEETSDLEKALDLLLSIPQKISDKKFLSNIEGFHGNVFHLGRLLRHDWFTVTREDDEVKQRYAFLFKNRILVCKVRKISEERSVFILKDIIKLPDYELEQVNDRKFLLRGFSRAYAFESPSATPAIEWYEILQQNLQPDFAVAQRTEENIRQLQRQGSIRKSSRQASVESRRASTQDSIKKTVDTPVKAVSIEEISLQEAKKLEQASLAQISKLSAKTDKPIVHVGQKSEKVIEGKEENLFTSDIGGRDNKETSNKQSSPEKHSVQSGVVKQASGEALKKSHEPVTNGSVNGGTEVCKERDLQEVIGLEKPENIREKIKEKKSEISLTSTKESQNIVDQKDQSIAQPNKNISTFTEVADTPKKEAENLATSPTISRQTSISKQDKQSDQFNKDEPPKKRLTKQKSTQERQVSVSEEANLIPQVSINESLDSLDSKSTTKEANQAPNVKTESKVKVTSIDRQEGEIKASGESAAAAQNSSNATVPSAEDLKQSRRRSSVIRRQSSAAMASENLPVFVQPLKSVECEPGDNATFECVTEGSVIINWLKGNRPLDDTLADRVKITTKNNKHSLKLLNCRDEDTGLYTAKLTDDKFGVATSSAVLNVHEQERQKKIQELNSPQFLVQFKDTELLKDTRVSFMFVVKGKPEPSLTIYHDGMVLQETTENSRLIKQPDDTYEFCIEKISEDNAGEYKVVAENKHGVAEVSAKVKVVEEKDLFHGIEGKRLLNPGEEPQFDWYLNGRPFTPDEKLKVLFREEEDTLALVFQHVTPDDAGLYTCVAQTSSGKISCSAELTVQGAIHQLLREPCPPTITAELSDTEVGVGGSAMMELKVSGFPKPQVTWFKNGTEELVAGGRYRFLYEDEESIALIIKNVTKEDAGDYVVKVVNDLGEVETRGKLIVKMPPKFIEKMKDMSCMTDEKLSMQVLVEGSPRPDVTWYKDGQLMVASERIKFTELKDGRFQITIERVTLEDSGNYSVVASNAVGQMSEFWNLVAHQPAKIIRKLQAEYTTELGSKGNQLTFSVQGVPDPTVTCTSSSTGKQLKVDNLGGGEYRVSFDCTERQNFTLKAEAKNEFGSDSCETQIYVRRSAQIVSKLQNIEVKEGEEVTVKVKVDSYPKPSKVNWFIDGLEISGKKYEQSESGDEYNLKIKSVERKDESNKLNVQIKVENELGQDECSASITIKSKPKIKKQLDAKYRLLENSKSQDLIVEVDSATFPEPKGTWYHNGKEVDADARIKISKKSSETYHLTFNVIKYEDAGEWSFKAENEVGEVWSKTTIIVEGMPNFSKGLPQQLEIIESEKMELDVIVQDFCEENVKITWTLDSDITLSSSETYNKEDNSAVSKILFVPTAGCQKLTVTATNKHGETETRSELIHVNLSPPTINRPLEKEMLIKDGEQNVRLKIEVDGSPPPKLSWCLNGEPLVQGTDELIIPVFSAANVGQYSVEAVNVAGSASSAGFIKMLQTKPSFSKGLEPSYAFKEGLDDLVLSVDIDGSPIPQVVWMKDGVPISPEADPRVSITNADGKSTLCVKNIDPNDKGRYSVSLKNPNGACESSTIVAVKPTPRAPTLSEALEYPKDINKKEKLEIKARIDGEPMPHVTFLHNDKPLQPNLWKVLPDGTAILTIENVQGENAGVYSLQLENEAGTKKVDTEPITVHEPPQRPVIEPPLTAQKVVEGLPFSFIATLKGYPLPELTLEKDGVEIKDIKFDEDSKTFEYSKSLADLNDAGVYKLTAKNSSGKVASEGKLEVVSLVKDGAKYEPKFIYELCDKLVDEGNELLLLAKVDGNPIPKVRWEFNGSPLNPGKYPQTFDGERATLRIPVAEREHQGLYKCVLENDEGKVESSSNVAVNKVYKPPSFSQKFTDQEQIPACDCKFGARISGIPAPTAKWFKDGTEILPGDKYKVKQDGDIVQLHVRNCTDADKGVYKCLLTNNQGTAECKAKLDVVKEVSHKPRGEIPYFLKTIGNTEVYPGMTAKFTACVGGYPDPNFEWFRGPDRVYESERIKFERDGASQSSGLLRLIIKDVDIGDLADYTLRIWNEHGDAECYAYLKYDTLADLNNQKLGDLYSGYSDTRPTAIPNRPLITNMSKNWMTLKWSPCLPHVSRIPCTYLVEMCPVNDPDNWSTLFKGLRNTYCDIEFPNPNLDYKFRIRVQWGPNHLSEPSPYAITMRNKFDTRPPQWKPMLLPTIPRIYDLSHPPHEGYTHAPRFLNKEKDYQYSQLGHPANVHFSVYGYPKPTLKFFKDDVEFSPPHTYLDNGLVTLFINRMMDTHEGYYECEATNPHGSARQKVYVRRADHPRFITRPKELYAMNRRSGKLSARIYGIPVPEIKIYKDWHLLPLTCDTRIRLQIVDIDEYTIDVFVLIDEIWTRDEGLYSIVATNVAGSIHSSAMIHVEESEFDYYFLSNQKGKDVRFRNMDVRNYYDFGDEIGRGTQSYCNHVVERSSGASYSSKTMITRYDPRRKEWIESEYNVWNGLNHRYISRLHDSFYHDDTYIFISDICTGHDILHSLISRDSFTEYEICYFIRQLLEGLEYLHVEHHIAHLSLTPLDLLLTHINSDTLRLIDFGLARKYFNKSLEYGHPEYVSPEIVKGEKNIGPWCDMWAVGIITYVLLSGHSPFLGSNDRETLENVKNGSWSFGERFDLISERGRDFIQRLLVYDYKGRMDIQAALGHSWFHMITEEQINPRNIYRDIHSSYYYKLKAWNENASCRTIYRRNPLETAYTDPSKMVYPPYYNEDDDYKLPIPNIDHLKLNGYPRPEIDDFVSESHYQSGEETYLLQLRDTDFPARLRQYMKVAASHSPSFQFNVYNHYCDRNIPVVRERRKYTDVMDEEVDDERKNRTTNFNEISWNNEPRRLRHEVGTRLDSRAEADALRALKRDGREPVFRETPSAIVNVRLGEEITLNALAAADPASIPTIQWFKNDMMVLAPGDNREIEEENGRSTLQIKEIRESDLTNYKIVARNKWGQIITRFRLRLSDEPSWDLAVPESLDYETETSPINITTEEIKCTSSLELISQGKFTSVILSENSRLLKVCTELEFNICKKLAHINLFYIHQASQIGSSILLEDNCLNYESSGNLLHYISSLDYYSEQLLMNFVSQILDALQYLHWQGLALLNLEPGNVIVHKYQRIKLVDFSATQPVLKSGSRVDCLTEPEFTAPEVLMEETLCMPQSDTWNVGILLYIMLSGVSPFLGESDQDTKQNVTFVRFLFEHLYKNTSEEVKRLIMLIFKRSPLKRPSADECFEHRWFQLSDSLIKKREKCVFETTKIKEYYANYLARKKSQRDESNLQDFISKYGAIG